MGTVFDVNSPFLYGITAAMVCFVIAQSLFFLVRAVRRARELGIAREAVRRTLVSSAVFTVMPAVFILTGVFSLMKMLGLPWPWLRLSILGAVTYELPAAAATAKAVGIATDAAVADPRAFGAIAWVMTLGILPGLILTIFGLKKLQRGENRLAGRDEHWGRILMDSLFLGMISAFIGMIFTDVRSGLSGFIPPAVALVSAAVMCVCGLLIKKRGMKWLEQYALPVSMLIAMAAAIPLTALMQ